MTTKAPNNLVTHFEEIERRILAGGYNSDWSGIHFRWVPLPLKRGGTLKRKGVYGVIEYSYRNQRLSRAEAIAEISKPTSLRQALIEATTTLECSMCGLTVVGKDAIAPYTSIAWDYDRHEMMRKRQWGLVFMRMNEHNEPIMLNLCPNCMQRIANGEFRD